MKRACWGAALLIFAAAFPGAALAQFGNLLGGGKDSGSASPEAIVKGYVDGAKLVLKAQERLLTAIGKKEEAAKAALQAENLTDGATKQSLEEAAKTQTENSKIIEDGLKNQETKLDAESKVVYGQGLGSLGQGVRKYVNLLPVVKGFKPGLNVIGSAAQGAMFIASSLPGNASNLQSTLSTAIKYGQSQGVAIPEDATAALK
jgi:hypothetical protein